MRKSRNQPNLYSEKSDAPLKNGPVECLGMTLENDAARRAYFLEDPRERALLCEFWEYRSPGYEPVKAEFLEGLLPGLTPKLPAIPGGRKIKVLRLEAVRVGFNYRWQNRDYRRIIALAQRIPESILQEDPKLLMWYDQALTRTAGD